MKTDKQIKAEIDKLKKMKPSIRRKTFFGDDNWELVDAQIDALEQRMDRDMVYTMFSDEADEESAMRVTDSALEASDWMYDRPDSEAPSESWKSLVTK